MSNVNKRKGGRQKVQDVQGGPKNASAGEAGYATRTCILTPWIKGEATVSRSPESRLEETVALARAIRLEIVNAETVALSAPTPSTLFGKGKTATLRQRLEALGVELVVVDGVLTPIQQRNLERAWRVKVLDRTGLILEIFGERAQSREGRLQVELAHLSYQKSRLVRSWTHLERQRGGVGFLGGPGETQIESDRRIIQVKITALEKKLQKVRRTRGLHRKTRHQAPYPVVALVGYTNAGKSTLFNTMTKAGVMARDLLFATLDPKMRAISLPGGKKIILSDTVGFISELPTHLVAAFQATLEEVLEAEMILHVRDISHRETEEQKSDVEAVLETLVGSRQVAPPVIEILNKTDLLDGEGRQALHNRSERQKDSVLLSATLGQGVETLLKRLDTHFSRADELVVFSLPTENGKAFAWLHQHGEVTGQKSDAGGQHMLVRVAFDSMQRERFEKLFPGVEHVTDPSRVAAILP